MKKFMIRFAWITAAIVLLGLLLLPIFYPPAQLPQHYYMDGPNYYIPTVENTANLAYIPLVCECGNDPSCVWDGVKWVKPSKWYNYV
tara:strand:+ start:117 stop:377 length:261 start_codon:yes stop_codon:yes gene_type:complete